MSDLNGLYFRKTDNGKLNMNMNVDLQPSDDRQLEVDVTERCHAENSSSLDLGKLQKFLT